MSKFFIPTLTLREKISFRIHLAYSLIEGVILGILALNEFVFIKSLNGKPYQLALLFQFSMLVFLLSPLVNQFLNHIRFARRNIRIITLLTRLPMLLYVFFPQTLSSDNETARYAYLTVFFLFYLANPVIYPNINMFLKNSYQHQNFGLLYSLSTSANKIIMLIVTFIFGILLDHNAQIFTLAMPLVGGLSLISSTLLTLIPFKIKEPQEHVSEKKNSFMSGVYASYKTSFSLVFSNREFMMFQIAFMLYGFAFMIGTPVTNLFYKEILDLNYTSVAFYKNIYNIIAIVVLPSMGKFLDKSGPMRFGVITFLSLLLYFAFVILTGIFPLYFEFVQVKFYYFMLIGLLFHGLFASTMSLLWNIGSAYFGSKEQAAFYQNTHLFLTGVRAIPAPFIGIWMYEYWGFIPCFGFAIVLLFGSIIVINRTLR